jgi:aryl-alcohol dehydrogenase-like predicted oxidoreductase
VALAARHGLDPAQMALAFVNSRKFLTSTVVGATSMAQLKSNIDSINVNLTDELIEGIERIHQSHPNPCP